MQFSDENCDAKIALLLLYNIKENESPFFYTDNLSAQKLEIANEVIKWGGFINVIMLESWSFSIMMERGPFVGFFGDNVGFALKIILNWHN